MSDFFDTARKVAVPFLLILVATIAFARGSEVLSFLASL